MCTSRREFLTIATGALTSAAIVTRAGPPVLAAPSRQDERLAREVGITTSSIDAHVSADREDGKIDLFDLPKLMRDELGMRVIDLNTRTLGSLDSAHVERFRRTVDDAGCTILNLKLNQHDLDLGNSNAGIRDRTKQTYRRCIDAAAILGARWVRPLPSVDPPVRKHLIAGYRQLTDYATAEKDRPACRKLSLDGV